MKRFGISNKKSNRKNRRRRVHTQRRKNQGAPILNTFEQQKLIDAGKVARDLLLELADNLQPGVSTGEIDRLAAEKIKAAGATSAFLGYRGFPGNICISLNHEVVHGIGDMGRIIQFGDLVKLDVGIFYDGWVGDNAISKPIGVVDESIYNLMRATEDALDNAILYARDGVRLGTLCSSIEETVKAAGYTVVREFVGHGVGRKLHEEPSLPNFGEPGTGLVLRAGMALAIEPMVNLGSEDVEILSDAWTAVTCDREISAHFEHTVIVGKEEPIITTPRERFS